MKHLAAPPRLLLLGFGVLLGCNEAPAGSPGGSTGTIAAGGTDSGSVADPDPSSGSGAGTGSAMPGSTGRTTGSGDEGDGSSGGAASDEDGAVPSGDCEALVHDPSINWRESTLQTDQEIVACLSESLGRPVGYGAAALGGYDPAGGSRLTVITKKSDVPVEQQILEAVSGDEHNWIVFDKEDFAAPSAIAMYRLWCDAPDVLEALGGTPEECVDHERWCAGQGLEGAPCLEAFFNERLNRDLPISTVPLGSNKTIDGRQSEAFFLFSGFQIGSDAEGMPVETERNVIVTNLRFQGAGHTEDHALDPDMIRSTGASHDIWIHQNTFDLTGDSAFDVKVGAFGITISFNLVRNVLRAALHGSSDDREINAQITTTMHHNAFITTDDLYDAFGNTGRRVPLLRRGVSHLFNNVFYGYRKDVLSVRVGARIGFEDNMFLANPAVTGDDDLDYFVENLLDDFIEGGLEISGSYVWLSDASCHLDPSARGDLTASHGATPDLLAEYDADSQAILAAHRLPAGAELADYVLGTAGKGGATPFNSPLAASVEEVSAAPRRACE